MSVPQNPNSDKKEEQVQNQSPTQYQFVAVPTDQANQKTSAAGVVALILGIIALVLSWIPVINVFAFLLGFIGIIFGIVGVVATVRKKRSGKGMAIGGLVVSFIAWWIAVSSGAIFWGALVGASAAASSQSSVASTSQSVSSQSSAQSQTNASDQQKSDEAKQLRAGDTVTLKNGLSIKVENAGELTQLDNQKVVAVKVTYQNRGSDKISDLGAITWKSLNAKGAESNSTVYLGNNTSKYPNINSVTSLAAGGSASGYVFFDAPISQVNYYSNYFADKPSVSWKLN